MYIVNSSHTCFTKKTVELTFGGCAWNLWNKAIMSAQYSEFDVLTFLIVSLRPSAENDETIDRNCCDIGSLELWKKYKKKTTK